MTPLVLLTLLGVAATGAILDVWSDGSDDVEAADINPDDIPENSHQDTLLGTTGDDEIVATDLYDTLVFGGEGNDTITGNDIIRTGLLGGAGDDVINIMHNMESDELSYADGGEGNDTINAELRTLESPYETVPYLSGGTGEDTFDLNIETTDGYYEFLSERDGFDQVDENGNPVIEAGTAVSIRDFVPDEDELIIDLTNDDILPGDTHEIITAELIENERGSTELQFTIERLQPDSDIETYSLITTVHLYGATDVAPEDVTILTDNGPLVPTLVA